MCILNGFFDALHQQSSQGQLIIYKPGGQVSYKASTDPIEISVKYPIQTSFNHDIISCHDSHLLFSFLH